MKKEFLLTIFLISFISISNCGFSQTSIYGVINKYTSVDSIYASKDTIEVSDASDFSADDTVMVYQAKGVDPVTYTLINPYNFGSVRNSGLHMAGKYEIIIIQAIESNKIIFKAFLNNDYDTKSLVQLIKVPSYKSVSVDGELTCDAWNGSTGGVLALMVSDTLFLNANINVSGKGFKGAAPFQSNGNCASVDSAIYGSQYFKESRDTISAGFKGEGVAVFDTTYRKGLGRWANGGGGGNARFSGGGGGGNSGNGGYGGEEDTTICTTPAYETNVDYDGNWNSLGGSDGFGFGVQGFIDDSTIFFGGGGGSGTFSAGMTASYGGNGGGIVIIIAKVIKSNGNSIISNGETVTDIADGSGAGGGAGGSVVFDIDSVIGSATVSIKGGDGGRVQLKGKSGPGGGGGGGPVLWNSTRPDNVTLAYSGGNAGYSMDVYPGDFYTHKAKSGSAGTEKINVKVPLTGFLFNNITSDQKVCMNFIPDLISGSEPRGGYGSYEFKWQERSDATSWVWKDITGATGRDYQPPAATDTIYYQRIVTSISGSDSIIDKGNEVEIIVHNRIENNQIFGDDTLICIGNEADTIIGTNAIVTGGDYNTYNYSWQYKLDDEDWNTDNALNDTTYLHGIVSDTTFVRRIVQSGACYDTTASVEIIGLPQISNNILSPDQEICYGQIPEEVIGAVPQGGDGSNYPVYWEEKTEGGSWNILSDSIRYNFAPSNLIETTYYRRVVQSDDCFDVSDSVKINVLPLIDNDSIVGQSLIYTCYNIQPQLINGSTPTGGDNTYSYKWQVSSDGISWVDTLKNATSEDYQPGALKDKTYYRRLVSSGVNDCCSHISDTIEVDIYSLPVASVDDFEDTICYSDQITLKFDINSGQPPYNFIYTDGESDYNATSNSNGLYQISLVPDIETNLSSKLYTYAIKSVEDAHNCLATEISDTTLIHVYGIPVVNAGINDTVCELEYKLNATNNFGSGIWSQLPNDGSTNYDDSTNASTHLTTSLAGNYTYIWKVNNWQCKNSDTVNVTMYRNLNYVNVKPFDKDYSDIDTNLRFTDEVEFRGYISNPDTFSNNITSTWYIDPRYSLDDFSAQVNDTVIKFTSLTDNDEAYIPVTWHVVKGVCMDTTIERRITLDEVFQPTGFTPNGDGINDYLIFNGVENSDGYNLIIFNRWGTEIYTENENSEVKGWNGKKDNKGKDLPEDTYYYILNLKKGNSSETKKGFIVLKRY